MESKKNFIDLYQDESYKTAIIDALCGGINGEHLKSFRTLLEYVIDKKLKLFDRKEFEGALYLEEDETLDLVLPCIRRVYGKVFITPPSIFLDSNYGRSLPENKRFKLFTLYFNIDEFVDYLIDMFIKSKDCLHHFEYIDRTAETLTLIVDNYVAGLVKRVRDVEDHEEAIESLIKQYKREGQLNQILPEN